MVTNNKKKKYDHFFFVFIHFITNFANELLFIYLSKAPNYMKNPLVSIIIPNYNHAQYLEQRIESILNQTYKNIEIILLDDHSNDNSVDIIRRYQQNPYVSHVTLNTKNSGSPFLQWQKGVKMSSGEFVWIAESDDLCENCLLETLVNEFAKDDKCVLAFCKSQTINSKGEITGEKGLGKDYHDNGWSFFNNYLYRYNYISNASSVIFKKDAFPISDDSFVNYRGCGDWIVWIEICKSGNVAYVNKPLNFYRVHDSNTTSSQISSGKNEQESAAVTQYMFNKKYISRWKKQRVNIAHIYSIKYGKFKSFFPKDVQKKLISDWGDNIFTECVCFAIHTISQLFNIHIIKR